MQLKQRAEQFLLNQDEYKAVTFLHKVTSNTTNSTYFYFMGELAEPFDAGHYKEYNEVVVVRISDHQHRDHVNSEWYSKNRVISSEEIDFADDLEDAKDIALGV